MIESVSRPAVARRVRLQFEPAQDAWVLLSPEGVIELNTPAAEILRRCDGRHSVGEIVGELELAFGQPGLLGDVQAFLMQARVQGWLAPVLVDD